MSFSRPQQGLFRPMVSRAWEKHARGNDLNSRDRAAKDAWYRAELLECLGRDTTKDCDPGRDFEKVMAHFETFVGGEIYWNLRIHEGDTRRLHHSIVRICATWEIDDAYARATAARVLKWEGYLDSLASISDPKDLQKVRIALLKHAHRHGTREDQATAQAIKAPAEPRAPLVPGTIEGRRVISPIYGATEAEFESDGVRARREALEATDAAAQKTARQFFSQAKRARQATQPALNPSEAEIDPENCPF